VSSLYAFIFGLVGAVIYRWRGHASEYKKYFPRPWNQIAFALPYAFLAYLEAGLFVSCICLAFTTLFVLSGHGNWFPKTGFKSPYEPETIEYPILWLKGRVPDELYKFIGMAISGLSISLSLGVVTGSLLIAFSGALKAPAYWAGRLIYDTLPKAPKKDAAGNSYMGIKHFPRNMDYNTELGEFLTGLFLWSSLWVLA